MTAAKAPLAFPDRAPPGYRWFDGEVAFDPAVHLQLETPTTITMLTELGYRAEDLADVATPVALSTPFRVLSDEGAAVMLDVARRLEAHTKPAGDRIERVTRGGCYRSRWLRDLCTSPEVTEHLGAIYGIDIAPHAMPLHLGHLNYAPHRKVDATIDKWHHDTLPLDYVLMVTDPAQVPGGRFEYFIGTKDEAAALAAEGKVPPKDRCVAPDFPGPGYAIALHGNMVVHRAAPLTEAAERITMVNGYVPLDTSRSNQSRSIDLIPVDDHHVLWTEWARFAAWRSSGRLQQLIAELPFTDDVEAVTEALESAIEDVQRAVVDMKSGNTYTSHYGG